MIGVQMVDPDPFGQGFATYGFETRMSMDMDMAHQITYGVPAENSPRSVKRVAVLLAFPESVGRLVGRVWEGGNCSADDDSAVSRGG
jgi:hypothetical protein